MGVPINEVFVSVNEATRLKVDNPLEKALARGVVVGLANHTNLISKSGADIPIDGSAAHDLCAPLNSVTALTEILVAQFSAEAGPEGRKLAGFMGDGLARMRRLLDDLLEFARASHFDERSAGLLPLSVPIQSAVQNLQHAIDQSGAEVTFESLPIVAMHETHAVQLLQNLLGNAIKYRGTDRPRIHIRAERKDSAWLISIADNGLDIEPQYVETIFKPFRRLHPDHDYPGSGIGLTTCRKIVEGYGGRIWAESESGKGSVFKFTLPAVEGSASRKASA